MAVENKSPVYMQPPRRLRRQGRGFTQQQLNEWLDEQERIIRARGLPDEIVEEFDPLYSPRGQLHQIYERVQQAVEQLLWKSCVLGTSEDPTPNGLTKRP